MTRRSSYNNKAIKRAIRKGAINGLEDVGDRIVELAIGFVPVNAGNLQRSIDHDKPRMANDRVSMEYGAYAPYAASVEYGTAGRGEPNGSSYRSPTGTNDWPAVPPGKKANAPYKIRPKNRKALRFEGANGEEVFAQEVTHPGVLARPFMRPAVDTVRHREAAEIMAKAMDKELRGALGGGR